MRRRGRAGVAAVVVAGLVTVLACGGELEETAKVDECTPRGGFCRVPVGGSKGSPPSSPCSGELESSGLSCPGPNQTCCERRQDAGPQFCPFVAQPGFATAAELRSFLLGRWGLCTAVPEASPRGGLYFFEEKGELVVQGLHAGTYPHPQLHVSEPAVVSFEPSWSSSSLDARFRLSRDTVLILGIQREPKRLILHDGTVLFFDP